DGDDLEAFECACGLVLAREGLVERDNFVRSLEVRPIRIGKSDLLIIVDDGNAGHGPDSSAAEETGRSREHARWASGGDFNIFGGARQTETSQAAAIASWPRVTISRIA